MTPFVSVIIPTFNRASVVLRAIDSVLKQTYKNFELIVVDDGSSDETEKILAPYVAEKRLQFFKQENKGVSAARNFGVKQSKGEWLSFLDSDDEWLKNKLEKQIELLKQKPDLRLVHGEEIWIRNGKRVNQKKIHQKFGGYIFEKCLPLCLISPSAVMIEKKLYQEMGGFDEEFIVCEDYDLWLKITSLYEVGFVEDPIIVKYGGHDDQLSHQYVAMDLWRIKAMLRILNLRQLSIEQKEATLREIQTKARILFLGYEKHQNKKGLQELEALLSSSNFSLDLIQSKR